VAICNNCESDFKNKPSEYSNGCFCSSKCARSYSTKNDNKKENKIAYCNKCQKSISVNKRTDTKKCLCRNCKLYEKECDRCFVKFKSRLKRQKFCSLECSGKANWERDIYRKKVTSHIRNRCSDLNERIRLKEIGRFGGFGKKGYTQGGTFFESNFEKKCFEYLEEKKIHFIPHKRIPDTSKYSDLYLPSKNLWVELDGIDREKRKKWLGENYQRWLEKLELYKKQKLKCKIFKNFQGFKEVVESNEH